jgi:nitronate monooxygenase
MKPIIIWRKGGSFMPIFALPELKIDNLTAQLPIIQGGMGVGISLSGLASAVANAGGIGVIATPAIGMDEPDFLCNYREANIRGLKKEIRKAKAATNGLLGVNIMVALSNYADMVTTAVDEGIDLIFSGAGLPLNLPELVGKAKTKLVPIVSSARSARILINRWRDRYARLPDAIVVEGPKAGGHLGFKAEEIDLPDCQLEQILPQVLEEVKKVETSAQTIPVIAAGGVYTGADLFHFLQLGAAGVQMGTRFVATLECDAAPEFKEAFINAGKDDLVQIESPVGLPGRAIGNAFLARVSAGKTTPFRCVYHCIKSCDFKKSPYCIAQALINAKKGRLNKGFAFAGQNAFRVREIISVKALFAILLDEFKVAQQKAASTQT